MIDTAHSVNEMIELASTRYDWVITDLNYGDYGGPLSGTKVLEQIPEGVISALCTSSSRKNLLKELASQTDYLVSPKADDYLGSKFELMGKYISRHYQTP